MRGTADCLTEVYNVVNEQKLIKIIVDAGPVSTSRAFQSLMGNSFMSGRPSTSRRKIVFYNDLSCALLSHTFQHFPHRLRYNIYCCVGDREGISRGLRGISEWDYYK